MIRKALLIISGFAVGAAVLAPAAPADTTVVVGTVGQLGIPTYDCQGSFTYLQTGVAGGNSFVVPAAGTITSWSFRVGAEPVKGLKLKVGRPAGGNDYVVVGEGSAPSQKPDFINTYSASIPVQAGDLIGLYQNGGDCAIPTGDALDTAVFLAGDQAPGPTPQTFAPLFKYIFPVQATITTTVPPPPPSNQFTIGKLNNNRKKGTAVSPVFIPGPGTLSAQQVRAATTSGTADRAARKKRRRLIKSVSLSAAAAGKVLVPLVPTIAGRKILREKGRFSVKVRITYTPTGGTPASQVFSPVLKLTRRNRH